MITVNWIRIFVIDPGELFGQPNSNFRVPEPQFLHLLYWRASCHWPGRACPRPALPSLDEDGREHSGSSGSASEWIAFGLMFQPVWWGRGETGAPVQWWWAVVVGVWARAALWKAIGGPSKGKSELPLVICPRDLEEGSQTGIVFTYWQQHYSLQPKGEGNPNAHLCKDDGWACGPSPKGTSHSLKKEVPTQATTWLDLEDIMFMKSTSHKGQVLKNLTYMRP